MLSTVAQNRQTTLWKRLVALLVFKVGRVRKGAASITADVYSNKIIFLEKSLFFSNSLVLSSYEYQPSLI